MTKKLKENFIEQANTLRLSVQENENGLTASGGDLYLSLVFSQEQYGLGVVVFQQMSIIIGDYQKAVTRNILNTEPRGNMRKLENGSYHLLLPTPETSVDAGAIRKLERFVGLTSCFYRCKEFTMFQQKGNRDLILKDPLLIQVLRGKTPLNEIIHQIKSLELPYGWIVQEPKGLGKKSTSDMWKTIGSILMILTIPLLVFVHYI